MFTDGFWVVLLLLVMQVNDLLWGLDCLLRLAFYLIRLTKCLLNFLIDFIVVGEEKLGESFLFWWGHFGWRLVSIRTAMSILTTAIIKINSGYGRRLWFYESDGFFNFEVLLWRILLQVIMIMIHDLELRLEDYIKTSLPSSFVLISLNFAFDQWKWCFLIVFLYFL